MTIILQSPFPSKGTLQSALQANPETVRFWDPSIVAERFFTGADIEEGQSFPIVMDHPHRRRFATVKRTSKGWRVV